MPWPLPSTTLASVVKLVLSETALARSGCGRVVAGVEHGDGRAGAVEAGGPGLGRVDLRDRCVERRPHPAVEVDARGSPRERGQGAVGVRRSGQRAPEGACMSLLGREGGRAERRERDRLACVLQPSSVRFRRRFRAGAVVDDHRERRPVRVVVPLIDQRRDVEEVEVEPVCGEERQRGLRDDIGVLADLGDRRLRQRPVRTRLEADRAPPVATGRHVDGVAGEQRHPVQRRHRRRTSRRRFRPRCGERYERQPGGEHDCESEEAAKTRRHAFPFGNPRVAAAYESVSSRGRAATLPVESRTSHDPSGVKRAERRGTYIGVDGR